MTYSIKALQSLPRGVVNWVTEVGSRDGVAPELPRAIGEHRGGPGHCGHVFIGSSLKRGDEFTRVVRGAPAKYRCLANDWWAGSPARFAQQCVWYCRASDYDRVVRIATLVQDELERRMNADEQHIVGRRLGADMLARARVPIILQVELYNRQVLMEGDLKQYAQELWEEKAPVAAA
jgi:hypothetical protein